MKTAEQIAQHISDDFMLDLDGRVELAQAIKKALTAYAEEYANTHYSDVLKKWADGHAEDVAKARSEGYAQGIEDAAKYLEDRALLIRGDWNGPDILNQSAHEIRALGEKK